MKGHQVSIRVRYKDTDQMGVVYYANYFVWFEVGRTELMRDLGLPYREFEKSELYLPVIKSYCEYLQPARYDDLLLLGTTLESTQDVRLRFSYDLRREEACLARGFTEHAFINAEGRPVVLRKFSPFLWNRLSGALQGGSSAEEGSYD